MQTLKRFFILPYLAGLFGLVIYCFYQLFTQGFSLGWIAAGAATLPLLIYMGGIALLNKGRASGRLNLQLGIAAGATLIALFFGEAAAIAIAVYGVLGLYLYDYWYTPVERDQSLLQVGAELPEFSVIDVEGNKVSSSTWKQEANLIMFIRGNWCPLCVAQVDELAQQYQELAAKGVQVRVISAQPEKQTQALAKKFAVDMQFYSDPDASAAEALNAKHLGGVPVGMVGYEADTVLPTVLITDAQGVIRYADLTENYRDRPEPALLMAEVGRL